MSKGFDDQSIEDAFCLEEQDDQYHGNNQFYDEDFEECSKMTPDSDETKSMAHARHSHLSLRSEQEYTLGDCKEEWKIDELTQELYKNSINFRDSIAQFKKALAAVKNADYLTNLIQENTLRYAEVVKQEIASEITMFNRKINEVKTHNKLVYSNQALKIIEKIHDKQNQLEEISEDVEKIIKLYLQLNKKSRLSNDFNCKGFHLNIYKDTLYNEQIIKDFSDEMCEDKSASINDAEYCQDELSNQFAAPSGNISFPSYLLRDSSSISGDSLTNIKKDKKKKKRRNKDTSMDRPAPLELGKQISVPVPNSKSQPEKVQNAPKSKVKKENKGSEIIDEIKQFEITINEAVMIDSNHRLQPNIPEDWLKKIQGLLKRK